MTIFPPVDWLVLGSIGVLFTSILVLLLLKVFQRKNQSYWVITFVGLGLAWLLIIIARLGIPHEIDLGNWQSNITPNYSLFTSSPTLLLDDISWAFSLTVISLGISAVMTAVSRLDELTWMSLFGILTITVLGLLTVQAGNPLTVLLCWTALDLAELILLLGQVRDGSFQKQVLYNFIFRFLGSFLFLGVVIYSDSINSEFNFGIFSIQLGLPVLISLGVRLSGEIFHRSIISGRSLGTMLWLVPLAANLSMLVRVAQIGIQAEWVLILLFLVIGLFFIANYRWLRANNEIAGRSFWLLSIGSISMLAAILGEPESSLIWGISGLLLGGILFLGTIRTRNLGIFPIIAGFSLSLLPFSPTWRVSSLFSALWEKLPIPAAIFAILIVLFGYSFFLFGYLQYGLRLAILESRPERWVWFLYIPGLLLLVFLNFALGWINLPELEGLSFLDWAIGIFISVLVIVEFSIVNRKSERFNILLFKGGTRYGFANQISILPIFYRLFSAIYRLVKSLISLMNSILEGEGGLLWAYLILVMLISLSLQFGVVR